MTPEVLTAHAAFVDLGRRVRLHWFLDRLRVGLIAGVGGASLLALVARLLDYSDWPLLALAWGALAVLAVLLIEARTFPGQDAIARAADRLGLAERVSSALYAQRSNAAVANLALADARAALQKLRPGDYHSLPPRRAWLPVLAGATVFALLALVPVLRAGSNDEAQRIATTRQAVAAIELQPPTDAARASGLHEREVAELRTLRENLARSQTTEDAARAIDRTQQRLQSLPSENDYSSRRAIDAAAHELQVDSRLQPLAQALAERNARAAQQALNTLDTQLRQSGALSDADRQRLQASLQAAANSAAASQPRLAAALRQAASQLASGRGLDSATSAQLQQQLDGALSSAAGLDELEATQADLSQLQVTTLPEGARLVRATGTPTALVLIPAAGSGSLVGQGGTGAGGGAGYGDKASQGRPSTEDAAATNGQPQVAPNNARTGTYDPVYAPSHIGGESGPSVQAPGDPTGAAGASVELPQGPLSVGDVRPYDQVYAEYADAARQSAARQSLPPNAQALVERYFGAIAPSEGQP